MGRSYGPSRVQTGPGCHSALIRALAEAAVTGPEVEPTAFSPGSGGQQLKRHRDGVIAGGIQITPVQPRQIRVGVVEGIELGEKPLIQRDADRSVLTAAGGPRPATFCHICND